MENHAQNRIRRQIEKDLEGGFFPIRYGFNYALWIYESIEYDQTPISHNLSLHGGNKLADVRQGEE